MDAVNEQSNREMSDDELLEWMRGKRIAALAIARLPENLVDVAAGDHGERLPAATRFSVRLPGWETRVSFAFSVERVPGRQEGTTRLVEHLSISWSMPEHLTKGAVRLIAQDALLWLAPIVSEWWPGEEGVHAQVSPGEPVPVADPATRQLTYRTPITAHFVRPLDGDRRGF